ncbi:MAG: hypothetical protein ABI444_13840 [Candidatus Kapaibacterium sp.]|jgi:hypothetical protein
MKRASVLLIASVSMLVLTVFCSVSAQAQFRDRLKNGTEDKAVPTIEAMTNGNGFLGMLLDPTRWSMHQSYTFSYSTSGSNSVGLGVFTNAISFKASDNMFFTADVSAVYSPFNTFGSQFSKEINGVYLSDARMDWRLGESTFLTIQYIGGPGANSDYGFYNSPFNTGSNMFGMNGVGTNGLGTNGTPNGWQSTTATVKH